jgi:hypothetical protein
MAKNPAAIIYGSDGLGGYEEKGTATQPFRTDPTGSTTQPISATELPLPAGAATGGKQDTGNALLVEIEADTDNLDVALSTRATAAAQIDGTQKAIVRGGAKGATVAADITSTPISVDRQALDVHNYGLGTGDSQQVEGLAADETTALGNPVRIGGVEGSTIRDVLVDNTGRLIVAPAGTSATRRGFSYGRVTLASTTIAPVTETVYTEQTANAQRSLVSASANDTAAGTGARTVQITYYDAALTGPYTEIVTLNGTTPVNTVATNICFIEELRVLTVGSGGSNAGIVSLKAATAGGGATIWSIAAGSNQTFGARHYVSAGYTCHITGFVGGIKGADTAGFLIREKDPTLATDAERQISDQLRAPSSGMSVRNYGTPIVVPGPSRITVYAVPDSTSSRVYYSSFDWYSEPT